MLLRKAAILFLLHVGFAFHAAPSIARVPVAQLGSPGFLEHNRLPALSSKRGAEEEDSSPSALESFMEKPANFVILPFLLLFGLDLLANIAVISKRSLEVLFTGHYTIHTF